MNNDGTFNQDFTLSCRLLVCGIVSSGTSSQESKEVQTNLYNLFSIYHIQYS